MKITLFLNNKIINFKLPNDIAGSYSFAADDDDKLINIEARNGKWVLYETSDVKIFIDNMEIADVFIEADTFYILKKDNIDYLVYITDFSETNILTYKYNINLNLSIGANEGNNILYNCPYMRDMQINIGFKDNQLLLQKQGTGVVYVNKYVRNNSISSLAFGDEIEMYGLRIIILNGLLLIANIKNKLSITIGTSNIELFAFPTPEEPQDFEIKDIDLYKKDDYFSKSPRLRRTIETKEVKLTPPPSENNSDIPMGLVIGPMLTMGLVSGLNLMNTMSKIASEGKSFRDESTQIITSVAMLVSMLVWPLLTQFYNRITKKSKERKNLKKYTKYLNEKREFLKHESQLQKSILIENLIPINECIDIIRNRKLNFWDKRTDQSDFMIIRIGTGDELLDVKINYNQDDFTVSESKIKKKTDELSEEFKYIKDVPIGYSFYENVVTAIMGDKYKTTNFINNIVLQLLTYYSYEDLKLVVFTNEKNKQNWEYLRYLNHSFTNDKSFRFFASDYDSAKNVSDYLNYITSDRSATIENRKDEDPFKPHYFIIIDDYDMVKKQEFITTISESEDNLGCTIVILENKLSNLPSKCNNFITIGDKNSGVLRNSYEKQEQTIFYDEIVYNINMLELAKILSNIPIEFEEAIGNLPESISFLEMEKVGKIEQLNIQNRWSINNSTTSLRAEIGVDAQKDLMYLDLHEKYHGPHGLIAGMTGSGKSEFIISYILSMAINYSPDDVAFILIDYKGGGLAYAFENKTSNIVLPHLAGTITNLDKAEMDRTLVSIDSEVKRRQRIFNDARDKLGESTIDIYKYQKFYKEGSLTEPIPHLFIICDEFAELKSQQPDFMDNLISVARIGRSLGVHLILATQKPSGVVNDQIWSNTKFRVCLKVQSASDSNEMLKRPEAASLKQAGRFYLQVGYDEYFALGQSAWCGAKYYPSDKIVKQVDKSINFINNNGEFIKSIQASNGIKIAPQGEQLASIMKEIINVAKATNKFARKLWLDNIPSDITVESTENKYLYSKDTNVVEAILGEYDAPEKQEQGILKYNYLEDGNSIIYGTDGSEKDLFLDTIIYSTTKNFSAEDINYYIIDYGSESLNKWNSLPHVGGVSLVGEDDKFTNLLKLITAEIQTRKKLFADYGGEYKNYIKNSAKKLPIIVVIINNYDALYESYQNLYDDLPGLVRDSERYGIIFVITGNSVNSVHSKVSQNFNNLYTFKLKDSSDYRTAFNVRNCPTPRDIVGRGLANIDGVHEFQTAQITTEVDKLSDFVQQFINEQKQINKVSAKKIPVLPDVVRMDNVESEISDLTKVPVGIEKKELEISLFDFTSNNLGNMISSNKLENTSKFVLSLLSVFKQIPKINVIVLDATNSLNLDKTEYKNYYTNNFDVTIQSLNIFMNQLIEGKNETYGIILIYGMSKFLSKLSGTEDFDKLIDAIKKYEKYGILIVDDQNKLRDYSYENWYSMIFNASNGIWVGKGISDQGLFRLSNITRDMTKECKNNMGYVINDGTGTFCKLIDFISSDEEEENDGK